MMYMYAYFIIFKAHLINKKPLISHELYVLVCALKVTHVSWGRGEREKERKEKERERESERREKRERLMCMVA